jgi:hypothetical protein
MTTNESRHWSVEEVELIVVDYLDMLVTELAGDKYNKAAHNRMLQGSLDNRSRGSVEMKHMNISAVMTELGYPCIDGYKPAWNYQRSLLPEIVCERIAAHQGLQQQLLAKSVVSEPEVTLDDILAALVATPEIERKNPYLARESDHDFKPRKVDFLLRDAANSELGLLGEKFALKFEKARLIYAGKDALADGIEHTSQELGDGTGYDIRSYEENGTDRFIEVKTTRFSRYTPFYVTPNELRVSQNCADKYNLYRVFQFKSKPQLFISSGSIEKQFCLQPSQYIAF